MFTLTDTEKDWEKLFAITIVYVWRMNFCLYMHSLWFARQLFLAFCDFKYFTEESWLDFIKKH